MLLDPGAIDPSGKTTIDFYVPIARRQARRGLALPGGTESGDVHVFDVATGKEAGERAGPRVQGGTAGGSVAWNGDGTGLWYTRYPREGERPAADLAFYQQVWFHRLGTPDANDRQELGDDLPRIAEIELESRPDGKWVVAEVRNGDGGEVESLVRPGGKGAGPASTLRDQVVGASLRRGDGALPALAEGRAPGEDPAPACGLTPAAGRDCWPARRWSSRRVTAPSRRWCRTRRRSTCIELDGGPSRVASSRPPASPPGRCPSCPVSSGRSSRAGRAMATSSSTTRARSTRVAWYRYFDPGGRWSPPPSSPRVSPVGLSPGRRRSARFATSKDGTRVPVNIIRRKGDEARRHRTPTILYGYGGYGICQTPSFSALARALARPRRRRASSPTCAAAASSARSGTSPAT